jgi:hypothetical protein
MKKIIRDTDIDGITIVINPQGKLEAVSTVGGSAGTLGMTLLPQEDFEEVGDGYKTFTTNEQLMTTIESPASFTSGVYVIKGTIHMPDGSYNGLSDGPISSDWLDAGGNLEWNDTETYVEMGNGNTMDRDIIAALVNPSNYLELSIKVNGVNELTIHTDYRSLHSEVVIPPIITNVSVDSLDIRVYAKLVASGLDAEGEISLIADVYELGVT